MQKQTQSDLGWNIGDLYRLLMQEIEPELLQENLALLETKYANESARDRKKRFAHYADCFELFLERLDKLLGTLRDHVSHEYHTLKAQLEQAADSDKDDFLSSFDDFLKDA